MKQVGARAPRNPTRRNRNLGTARAGHGQDNRLVIPERWDSPRCFYEELVHPVSVARSVAGRTITFLVERPAPGFGHACTLDDLVRVLSLLASHGAAPVDAVVLRQPTRKQRVLSPVWGRLRYFSPLGSGAGPAVFLEAQPTGGTLRWGVPHGPYDERELERLRQDGHALVHERRGWVAPWDPRAVRTTQLQRTIPHEVGHWVDYATWADRLAAPPELDDLTLHDRYFARPGREREAFAHRYADESLDRHRSLGRLPFPPLGDPEVCRREGLDPAWFPNLPPSV